MVRLIVWQENVKLRFLTPSTLINSQSRYEFLQLKRLPGNRREFGGGDGSAINSTGMRGIDKHTMPMTLTTRNG